MLSLIFVYSAMEDDNRYNDKSDDDDDNKEKWMANSNMRGKTDSSSRLAFN